MDVDGFDRTCDLATETGPAVGRVLYLCLFLSVHHDYVSGTEFGAQAATDADLAVDLSNHFHISTEKWLDYNVSFG